MLLYTVLGGGLGLITSFSMICFVILANVIDDRAHEALNRAETAFVSQSLQQTIERNLSLGFRLEDLRQIETVLEQAVADHRDVIAVEVFDLDGRARLSSDPGAVGEAVPSTWLNAIEQGRAHSNGTWSVRYLDTRVSGLPLRNDFDAVLGWLAIVSVTNSADRSETSQDHHIQPVRTGLTPLGWVTIGFMAVGFAVTAAIGYSVIAVEIMRRRYQRLKRGVASPVSAIVNAPATSTNGTGPVDRLANTVEQARTAYHQASVRIERATALLRRIDAEM